MMRNRDDSLPTLGTSRPGIADTIAWLSMGRGGEVWNYCIGGLSEFGLRFMDEAFQ